MVTLVVGPDYFHYTDALGAGFQSLGHTVRVHKFQNYIKICSYIEKKILKSGYTGIRQRYYQKWNTELIDQWWKINPNLCIICNGECLLAETLKLFASKSTVILWLFDSILLPWQNKELLPYYHHILVFDPQDVLYIKQQYGLESQCINMGYDPSIFHPQALEKDIDICFVGRMTPKRGAILRQVAEYARQNEKKMLVYGKWWNEKQFWKRRRFEQKYQPLQLFIPNVMISPVQAARLYNRSKICLNIHIKEHEGINPRTFEICGTNSFQLIDYKTELWKIFAEGKNLIAYRDADDLVAKIQHFLADAAGREEMARRGHELVRAGWTVADIIKQSLATI
jgi:spore maturation protein CgeB